MCKQCIIRFNERIDVRCFTNRTMVEYIDWQRLSLNCLYGIFHEFSCSLPVRYAQLFCLHLFPLYLFWITVANDYFLLRFSVFSEEKKTRCGMREDREKKKICWKPYICVMLMRLRKYIYHETYSTHALPVGSIQLSWPEIKSPNKQFVHNEFSVRTKFGIIKGNLDTKKGIRINQSSLV